MKITEYPSVTDLKDANVFLLDGPDGTKTIAKSDFVYALFDSIPEMHKSIYRGKNLGTSVTSAQSDTIKNGKFHDIWLGDYWEIGNVKYYVADFDYYYGGARNSSISHHVLVWPSNTFGEAQAFNTTGDLSSIGYANSTVRQALQGSAGDTTAYTTISTAFANHLVTYNDYLSTGIQKDYDQSIGWSLQTSVVECTIELPSVGMLFPSVVTQAHAGGYATIPSCETQFALLSLKPQLAASSSYATGYYHLRSLDWRHPDTFNLAVYDHPDGVQVSLNKYPVRPFFLVA